GMANESIKLKYARSEDVQMLKSWYLRGEKNESL
ncbi:hypothetical protein LHK27_13760, partial [Staphylococcus argenteus]|nr:hypothetical protein [Staphylococcus argenteus]